MDLVKSGAVTNYRKEVFRGKSVASYALGTPELMAWLDRNPLVEFQGVEQVFDPIQIGRNPNFVAVFRSPQSGSAGQGCFLRWGREASPPVREKGRICSPALRFLPEAARYLDCQAETRKGDPISW